MDAGYSIGLAAPSDLPLLAEIERAAAQLFVGRGLPQSILDDATSPEDFQEAQQAGLLWVALCPQRQPIGFAHVELLDGTAHLEEIDVHPNHGRRGVGAALLRAVCAWARQAGHGSVTLTTFRDIPWNAPFYARLGFAEIPPQERSPVLARRVREEAEKGLDPERRVVMRFAIDTA